MYVRQYTSDARAREKPCVRCGQSLRKNFDDRYCPACGLSVWMTLSDNDALDYSSARWLRKASRGAWAMAGVQLIALAAYLIALGTMFTFPAAGPTAYTGPVMGDVTSAAGHIDEATFEEFEDEPSWGTAPSVPLAGAVALAGLYFALEGAALVMLTPHEQRYPDKAKRVRVAARIVAGLAVMTGVCLGSAGARALAGGGVLGVTFSSFALLGIELVFVACAFCSWLWLRRIARRAGKSWIAKLCGYLLFLPVLPLLKAAPFFGLWAFYLLGPLLHFLPLIYLPVSIFLYARCARLLGSAAPHAEAAWASETRPTPA